MDSKAFRVAGHKLIDYIADYYDTLETRKVSHQVEPGYLAKHVPSNPPEEPESFDVISKDVEDYIMPGVTHWQSGNFYSYYPSNSSFPSMLGEMYSNMINAQGFSWDTCPAMTELETIAVDWLGKLIGLPESFLSTSGTGCGTIQGSASEALLVTLIAAREKACDLAYARDQITERCVHFSKLVCYCSDQTHSSAQKASHILGLTLKVLETNEKGCLEPETLESQIKSDLDEGLIPFYCVFSIGTTAVSACDDIVSLVKVAEPYRSHLWLHVDAAYAGSALIIDRYQSQFIPGISLCDSFNFNPHKWLRVNFDCSTLWFKDRKDVVSALTTDASFFKKVQLPDSDQNVLDFKDLQIPLGRRFRSLKLWFTMRALGGIELRRGIQTNIDQAKQLYDLLMEDGLYQTVVPYNFSLLPLIVSPVDPKEMIDFTNERTRLCAAILDKDPDIVIHTAMFKRFFIIRISIGSPQTTSDHILALHRKLQAAATKVRQLDIVPPLSHPPPTTATAATLDL